MDDALADRPAATSPAWIAVPAASVGIGAGLTGGAPLAGAMLLALVAVIVRRGGTEGGRHATGWAVAGVVSAQAVASVAALPSVPDLVDVVVAALVVAVVLVGGRQITAAAAEHEAAGRRVVDEQARVRAVLAGSNDLTIIIGDGEVTYQSPSTNRLLGYADGSLLGRRYLDLVHPEDRDEVIAFVQQLLVEPGASGLIAGRMLAADGAYVPVESSCRNLLHDPAVRGFVVVSRDVSERQELQAQLTHRAFHDDLTGLPNRSLLLDRLHHAADRAKRDTTQYALLYIDLDGFKPINDHLGSEAGDQVLATVARRLEIATRRSDTVARLGGDEFAVLLEGTDAEVDAGRVATRVLDQLRRPFPVAGAETTVTASLGIAYGHHEDDPDAVLRNADIAMYLAKRDGKDRFEVFEPAMHLAVVERLQIEADLQHALEAGELAVHYQPIVTLADRRIVGVEALARWHHPERGDVPPGRFIPVAEETGLIADIGRFVLREACQQAGRWRRELPAARTLGVSVNVSMHQLIRGDLVGDVEGALAAAGLPSDALTLELTESALVQDTDRTLEVLHELKALGVHLAVDDFGTGYSSLAYLHRFPVDVLKIDRSFVTSIVTGRQSPALARAIVDLGRSLDLITVAEGIEHDEELNQFRELRCALGQGYLFARPGDATTVEETLRSHERGSPAPAMETVATIDHDRPVDLER